MNAIGKNTMAGEQLRQFVESIESVTAQIKELQEERNEIKREAKAQGFSPTIITNIIRRRAAKPHDLQEHDALMDLYQHALGMLPTPPLFRAIGLAGDDGLARETVIERMKNLVPPGGEIVIKIGKPVRVWRDQEGNAHAEDVIERPKSDRPSSPARAPARGSPRAAAPDVDSEGAYDLGWAAAKNNQPVIENPFPFGDGRRARWDEGWRAGAGSDGMGPDS